MDVILDRFGLKTKSAHTNSNFNKSYNIAPQTNIPVISQENPNVLSVMKWGMVPAWSKTEKMPYNYINIKFERIYELKTTLKLIDNQRCIIPASGFFEWKKVNGKKIPYYFTADDQKLFGLAGLYSIWKGADRTLMSFAIITTQANKIVQPIHNRMPVILGNDNVDSWLYDELTPKDVTSILQPYPDDRMSVIVVSPKVNNVRNNESMLIEPYSVDSESPKQSKLDEFF